MLRFFELGWSKAALPGSFPRAGLLATTKKQKPREKDTIIPFHILLCVSGKSGLNYGLESI